MSWERYGPLKAECDRIVQKELDKSATIVRPTYIVGPKERQTALPIGSIALRAAAMC